MQAGEFGQAEFWIGHAAPATEASLQAAAAAAGTHKAVVPHVQPHIRLACTGIQVGRTREGGRLTGGAADALKPHPLSCSRAGPERSLTALHDLLSICLLSGERLPVGLREAGRQEERRKHDAAASGRASGRAAGDEQSRRWRSEAHRDELVAHADFGRHVGRVSALGNLHLQRREGQRTRHMPPQTMKDPRSSKHRPRLRRRLTTYTPRPPLPSSSTRPRGLGRLTVYRAQPGGGRSSSVDDVATLAPSGSAASRPAAADRRRRCCKRCCCGSRCGRWIAIARAPCCCAGWRLEAQGEGR